MRRLIIYAAMAMILASVSTAKAAEEAALPAQKWSFDGMFGRFDKASLKRGFQIYQEVCSSCHSLRLLSYRNLTKIGFTKDEVKSIAADYETQDGPNDEGEMFMRPSLPSDRFVSPFANEKAARASNNGSLPPDLSLIVKARKGGADYIYALLTGFSDELPEGFKLMDGMNYNEYYSGNQIAMPMPIEDDSVEYTDGTKATLDQEARDITTFLTWASSPEMDTRKSMGLKVLLFLIVLTALLYALKRRIWSDVH